MTEPTQPADYSRYESTQTGIPPIPPPPPTTRRPWWHIGVPVLMVVALVTLIVVPNVALSKQPTPVTHIDPGATEAAQVGATQRAADTATASVPTPTPTATPLPTNYTALTIMQDYTANGLPTAGIDYTKTVTQYLDSYNDFSNPYSTVKPAENTITIASTSQAYFTDPTNTEGQHMPSCAAQMWLGVYSSVGAAQNASGEIDDYDATTLGQDCQMPYNAFFKGRCVLVTYEPSTSEYVVLMDKYCV
jgi:hypothetical protein